MTTVAERLDYLRGEIEAERISYGEVAELQSLAAHIDPSDAVLLQWAGVPEFPDDTDDMLRDRYPGYLYDGRDGSIEAEDDDEDRIEAEDEARREEWSSFLEWQRDMGA